MAQEASKGLSHTLKLPQTDLPIQANPSQTEPAVAAHWQEKNLYRQVLQHSDGWEKFVLHNGPPYANGNIHVGHILNLTLKDIVCRSKRMAKKQVFMQFGWDCHGLPIELLTIKKMAQNGEWEKQDKVLLKQRCKEFAQHWIETQRAAVERLGVIADFENYYSTMSPEYEAGILEVFAKFVAKQLIFRREKTVPWCHSCQTTLASAEIEYKDRKDPSCFVLFPFNAEQLAETLSTPYGGQMFLLAWTTTPWTLPLNRALVLRPNTDYAVVKFAQDKAFIVAEKLVAKVCGTVGIEPEVLHVFNSSVFTGKFAQHPFEPSRRVPVVFDDMVSLEDGTAVVHCAPGCGPEDYQVAVREGIEIYSPLNPDGTYSDIIFPAELRGVHINDGQWWALKYLQTHELLLHKGSLVHSYPCCWRCKNPLMFRATKQWFCHLENGQLREQLLSHLDEIKFIPDWGKNRLEASVKTRSEWCISRQRSWGVPIIALKCSGCDQAFTSQEFVEAVAAKVETQGIVYWDNVAVDELLKLADVPTRGCECAESRWQKETDIIDVWFESGSSFWSVVVKDKRAGIDGQTALGLPADLYLEGSDQHRAWFQASLLCAMAAVGKPCMKAILTHGYIVDEKREKMSKSVGNVLDAQELMAKYGADVLRLWVCSTDYQNDAPISHKMLEHVAGIFRKIRNTMRFMLSNLYDYDGFTDAPLENVSTKMFDKVPDSCDKACHGAAKTTNIALHATDFWALHRLLKLSRTVRQAYEDYDFVSVFSSIVNFCNNDLSAEYLDIIKDRLYTERAVSNSRRAAQATCQHVLTYLTHLIAPVLPFLTEEINGLAKLYPGQSLHMHTFADEEYLENMLQELRLKMVAGQVGIDDNVDVEAAVDNFWAVAHKVRDAVLRAIEKQRELKTMKLAIEAKVALAVNLDENEGNLFAHGLNVIERQFEGAKTFLADFFIVSQVDLSADGSELEDTEIPWLKVTVSHVTGEKCVRCWKWYENLEEGLCQRCVQVLAQLQKTA